VSFLITSVDMTPIQILRIGFGSAAVQVPIVRLPFAGGADSDVSPGGFFTSEDGEIGIVVDARLGPEEAQQLIAREVQNNLATLEAMAEPGGAPERLSHPAS
jgi:hypothetical protein